MSFRESGSQRLLNMEGAVVRINGMALLPREGADGIFEIELMGSFSAGDNVTATVEYEGAFLLNKSVIMPKAVDSMTITPDITSGIVPDNPYFTINVTGDSYNYYKAAIYDIKGKFVDFGEHIGPKKSYTFKAGDFTEDLSTMHYVVIGVSTADAHQLEKDGWSQDSLFVIESLLAKKSNL